MEHDSNSQSLRKYQVEPKCAQPYLLQANRQLFQALFLVVSVAKARIFLLVDLREFFSDLGRGGGRKKNKKSSENDQLTGHFQSFFLISPEKTVKLYIVR